MTRFEDFVVAHVGDPPSRLLEFGCGQGELTTALAVAGYDVIGIDPVAPPGEHFRPLTLEELDEPGRYEAVVGALALHHVRDLDFALDRIVQLLRPGGLLLLDEFVWDALDGPTLDWLYGQQRALAAAGQGEMPASAEALRDAWETDHLGLHGEQELLAGVASRFDELELVRTPHLHRIVGGIATEVLEQALIDAGAIRPLGFRYAGRARSGAR